MRSKVLSPIVLVVVIGLFSGALLAQYGGTLPKNTCVTYTCNSNVHQCTDSLPCEFCSNPYTPTLCVADPTASCGYSSTSQVCGDKSVGTCLNNTCLGGVPGGVCEYYRCP